MNRLAAAISFAALLPLAGCATPYGYSKGAWAYYDRDFDSGQEGYQRPITYYGEAVYGRPYGNDSTVSEPQYSEWSYEMPAYAGRALPCATADPSLQLHPASPREGERLCPAGRPRSVLEFDLLQHRALVGAGG